MFNNKLEQLIKKNLRIEFQIDHWRRFSSPCSIRAYLKINIHLNDLKYSKVYIKRKTIRFENPCESR